MIHSYTRKASNDLVYTISGDGDAPTVEVQGEILSHPERTKPVANMLLRFIQKVNGSITVSNWREQDNRGIETGLLIVADSPKQVEALRRILAKAFRDESDFAIVSQSGATLKVRTQATPMGD